MKRIDRLKDLREIYQSLSKPERNILMMQVQEFKKKEIRGYAHCQSVISALSDLGQKDEKNVLELLKKEGQQTTEINQILLLTKGLLLEQLQLEANIERPGVYSNPFRTRVGTSKKIQQARVLLSRGLNHHAVRLLEECVSKARKYELFELELEALELLQLVEGAAKGTRTFNRFAGYIKEAERNRALNRLARHTLVNYRVQEPRRNQQDRLQLLSEAVASLDSAASKHSLGYPIYIKLILKTELEMLSENYKQAEKTGRKLLEMLKGTPAVQSQERETHVNLMLAKIFIHLRKFAAAIEALNEAEGKAKKSSAESALIREYKTFSLFYSKDLEALGNWLPVVAKSKYTVRDPYATAKFGYFQAVYDFLQADFASCAKSLVHLLSAQDDSTSSDSRFGHSLLLFMASMDMDKDQIEAASSFREKAVAVFAQLEKDATLDKRIKTTIRIIRRLEGQQYEPKKAALLVKGSLARLGASAGEVKWQPLTYEIIPFHLWLDSKMRNKAYRYKLPALAKSKVAQ